MRPAHFSKGLKSQPAPVKRLLFILLTRASHAFAGPNVRVSIDAQGDGSGLILQDYTTCLRNTPGVVVVPLGQPADALIVINSVILSNKAGAETGYAWAMVVVDSVTKVLLEGPDVGTAGSHQGILQEAASSVQSLNRDVFISLRNRPNN